MPIGTQAADQSQAAIVIARLCVAVDELFAQMRRNLGVGPNERLALEFLWEKGPMPMSELAGRLTVTRAAVTTLIDRMEEDGFIERSGDIHDRRRTIVSLSAEGHRRMCAVGQRWLDALSSIAVGLDGETWARAGTAITAAYEITTAESARLRELGTGASAADV